MLDLIVTAVQREAPTILAFDLARADGGPYPASPPAPIWRSPWASPAAPLFAVRHARPARPAIASPCCSSPTPRGGSQACTRLQVGDRLQVSEPRNLFALVPSARRTQLLAGGIGITPLLAMAEQLYRQGARFTLRYLVRDAKHAAFIPWLKARPYAEQVRVHFDQHDPALRPNFQHLLGPAAPERPPLCLRPGRLHGRGGGRRQAQGWQTRPDTIGSISLPIPPPGRAAALRGGAGAQRAPRAGTAERSVVEVLADMGVVLPVSCGQGLCGTCLTPVLDGEPEHRDLFLSAAEHARQRPLHPLLLPRQGRAVVLDL